MRTPDQIKSLLLHPDYAVRDHASQYFAESGTTDPEVATLSLQAIQKYGYTRGYGYFLIGNMRELPLSPDCLPLLLQVLAVQEQSLVIRDLNAALGRLPLDAWPELRPTVKAHPNVKPETIEQIERRLEFSLLNGPDLLDRLQQYCEANDELDSSQIDHALLHDLLEGLTRCGYPPSQQIREVLLDEDAFDSWFHVHLIQLVGVRRLPEFTPILVDFLEENDTETLQDGSEKALRWVQDPLAIPLIQKRYPRAHWTFKLYGSAVLGATHSDVAEQAILQLLQKEREPDSRAQLCMALSDQFSDACFDLIPKELKNPRLNEVHMRVDLEEALLTLAIAWGRPIANQQELWVRREERNREVHKWEDRVHQTLDAGGDIRSLVEEVSEDEEEGEEVAWDDVDGDDLFDEGNRIVAPIRRDRVILPNEKCPCRSGKKFKKCCGGLA